MVIFWSFFYIIYTFFIQPGYLANWGVFVLDPSNSVIKRLWGIILYTSGFKFNFFDSLLKLACGIIFDLLNLSANLLFLIYKHC